MLGTAVSVASISCLAVGGATWPPAAVTALLQALSSALLMNVAIVGLNQMYDIEIDKVRGGRSRQLAAGAGGLAARRGRGGG